jgi:hypothetical protein
VRLHAFLISTLDGTFRLVSCPPLHPGDKALGTHSIGGRVGSRAGIDALEKKTSLASTKTLWTPMLHFSDKCQCSRGIYCQLLNVVCMGLCNINTVVLINFLLIFKIITQKDNNFSSSYRWCDIDKELILALWSLKFVYIYLKFLFAPRISTLMFITKANWGDATWVNNRCLCHNQTEHTNTLCGRNAEVLRLMHVVHVLNTVLQIMNWEMFVGDFVSFKMGF